MKFGMFNITKKPNPGIRRLSTSGPAHDVSDSYYAQTLSMHATPAEYFYACVCRVESRIPGTTGPFNDSIEFNNAKGRRRWRRVGAETVGLRVEEKCCGAEKGVATNLEGIPEGKERRRASVRSSAMIDDFRSCSVRPGGKHCTVRLAIREAGPSVFVVSTFSSRSNANVQKSNTGSNERKFVHLLSELSGIIVV
ncbi:hypothetical protein M0804_013658 [Polistes exclamans]|nr:hypothetical protein M0804_013658 [Polistes exclamans]